MKKQKTENLKTNKGITLIALVITIIVMLILVAVTISMAVNGGLFEYASNAGTQTNAAVDAEQVLANGRVKIDGIWYDSINSYIKKQPSANQGNDSNGVVDYAKYFTYTIHDSTKVASNAQTKTTLTRTATITGIKEEYSPKQKYYDYWYGEKERATGSYIQDGDKKITDIVIPTQVTYEGQIYTVTEIGDNAFDYSEITSVTIPEGITKIGGSSFSGCTSLAQVTIPASVEILDDHAFYGCSALKDLILKEGEKSACIGCYTFSETGLTELSIPSNYTSIGIYAFCDSSLTKVTIPGSIKVIPSSAFARCEDLRIVELSEGLEVIGRNAFYGSIDNLTIPSSVVRIEGDAFLESDLGCVIIPASVKEIGADAFWKCKECYCEVTSKPDGWSSSWCSATAKIYWGTTGRTE